MEKKKNAKIVKTVKKPGVVKKTVVTAKKTVVAKKIVAPVNKEVVVKKIETSSKKVTARAPAPKTVERKPAQRLLTAEGWKRRKMREHAESR